jgi:hypothetical protein
MEGLQVLDFNLVIALLPVEVLEPVDALPYFAEVEWRIVLHTLDQFVTLDLLVAAENYIADGGFFRHLKDDYFSLRPFSVCIFTSVKILFDK